MLYTICVLFFCGLFVFFKLSFASFKRSLSENSRKSLPLSKYPLFGKELWMQACPQRIHALCPIGPPLKASITIQFLGDATCTVKQISVRGLLLTLIRHSHPPVTLTPSPLSNNPTIHPASLTLLTQTIVPRSHIQPLETQGTQQEVKQKLPHRIQVIQQKKNLPL